MSNSPQADRADSGPRPGFPTAMIHKKILDVAREDPDASLTEISNRISGASAELVERVLENYGDPAERLVDETADRQPEPDAASDDEAASGEVAEGSATDTAEAADPADHELADDSSDVEPDVADPSDTSARTDDRPDAPASVELTDTQLETLAAVAEHPQATQRELADVLGVSCATVNRRVNAVDGLAWDERQSFVESLFTDRDLPETGAESVARDGSAREKNTDSDAECASEPPLDDPELVRKVLHACLESDRISADEELEIIAAFVGDA